jgi:putative sigma-54 modulation protein
LDKAPSDDRPISAAVAAGIETNNYGSDAADSTLSRVDGNFKGRNGGRFAIPGWGRSILGLLFSDQGGDVRIEIRGRNVEVTEELREHVEKRFRRIGNQVADQALLDVEHSEERNPPIPDSQVAEATLQLKGVTLRAHEASPDMMHTIHELAEDVRRQVKRHREKRRKRRQTRRMVRGLREHSAES